MRRIGLLLTAVVAFVLVQGCGTTNRNKAVVTKPGQASAAAPDTGGFYTSKGTTTAAPVQKAPPPPKKEKPALAPKPEPVKKEVAKAEPKPAPAPAPVPKKEATKPGTGGFYTSRGTTTAAPVQKAPPPPKKEKPAPAPKPEPVKKEVAKAEPKPAPKKEAPAKPAPAPKKEVAKVEPAKKSAPAAAASVKAGAKLGAVSQVNNEYKFIVIEFEDENKKLTAGSIIQIVRGGKVVAKAKLEEPLDHWPLATATVIEGTPEKADSVSQ